MGLKREANGKVFTLPKVVQPPGQIDPEEGEDVVNAKAQFIEGFASRVCFHNLNRS